MRDYEEDQMRQRERERRRAENRKRARERQRKKRMLVMGGMGCCAVILIVAGIWLMAGRTGKAQLSEGDEKAVQEQTTEALSDSGAKTTSENETEVASQDEEQVSGEIEQSEETAPAQTSSMPFAVGYDAQETCLLYTSPSPRDSTSSRMPSSA